VLLQTNANVLKEVSDALPNDLIRVNEPKSPIQPRKSIEALPNLTTGNSKENDPVTPLMEIDLD